MVMEKFDQKLVATLTELEEEQTILDRTLAELIREKTSLFNLRQQQQQQQNDAELSQTQSASTLRHYEYILPLVRDIYLLELKIQEQQKAYDDRKWRSRAAALGADMLAASLKEDECVLKRWSTELSSRKLAEQGVEVTDTQYQVAQQEDCLKERLAFTVLTQAVHVRVEVHTELPCQTIHFLRAQNFKLRLSSETFIPSLEETVVSQLSNGGPVSSIISLVARHIQEDIAPYVIVIATKKKKSSKKAKAPGQTGTSSKADTVDGDAS